MSYQILSRADDRPAEVHSGTLDTFEAAASAYAAAHADLGANERGDFYVYLDGGQFYVARLVIRDHAAAEDLGPDQGPTAVRTAEPAPLIDLPDPETRSDS